MSLHVQPGPAASAAEPERVAVILSGFRNDLGRHRALALLEQRFGVAAAVVSLPFTVSDSLDIESATRLTDELSRLGAIAAVTRRPTEPSAPAPAVTAQPLTIPIVLPEPSSKWRIKPLRIVGQFGAALRIPVMVFVGMLMFSTFRIWMINHDENKFLRQMEEARAQHDRAAAEAPPPPGVVARTAITTIQRLLADGKTAEALAATQTALENSDDPALWALRGDVYVQMSNWVSARTSYERAIKLGSKDGKVCVALAEIYRQEGMQSAAVDMLHRAKEYGASGGDFEALVQIVKSEQQAESEYGSESSPHFTISFDQREDHAEAQRILALLEDAYLDVGRKLDAYPEHRIPVVIYGARDFQDVTHAPGWAGALYDGRIKIPVRNARRHAPDLAGTIRHEYTHALINTIAGSRCPVWLNEGVAMWAEERRDGEREKWALSAIQLEKPTTLTKLEGSFIRLSGRQAVAAYARSYLAVRHIVERHGQIPLRKLLEAFRTSKTSADAFREALDVDLAIFEEELLSDQGEVG